MSRIPPSASTRFQRPIPVGRWLARPRMDPLFQQVSARRLTLIHAPAGFGKSTLAAQWAIALGELGARTAWLSLDEDDARPLWFLTHLLECFTRVHPEIDEHVWQILEERPEDAEKYVLPELINAVHLAPERTVVVLDDWHLITEHRTRMVLAKLLEDAGDKLGFIITSRSTAGLPLMSLRVHDQLVEVDPQAIRFDEKESHQFLVGMKGIELSAGEFSELHDKTEGWVAALQLTSLSLRKHADVPALLSELSTRRHGLGEYLTENVLDHLDLRLREFLLRTSVLTRVNGELAQLLTGQADAAELLGEALAGDLFLQRLGETGEWFRYHHLFADYLRDRLRHEHPELVAHLHFQAAKWYDEHGMLSQAVAHAMLANEPAYAADAVERQAIRLVEHSRMSTLLTLVEKLPPEQLRGRARMQIAIAWAYCLLHFAHEADRALVQLDEAMRLDGSLGDADRFRLNSEALVVRECLEMYQDHVTPNDRLRADVLELADQLDAWTVSVAANVLTFFEINRDRAAHASEVQRWAQPYHRDVVGSFSEVYGACFAGLIAFHELDIPLARHHWEHAFRVGSERSGGQSHAARLALGLLGKLHYHLGQLDRAEQLFTEALRIGQRAGVVDFMFPVYESLAFIRMSRGDAAGALAVIEQGERAGYELSLVRLWARMATTRARLGLEAMRPTIPVGASQREREYLEDEAVRFDLSLALHASGDDQAVDLENRAVALLQRNRSHGNRFQEIRDQLMLVGALEVRGRAEAAETLFAEALIPCEASGMVQMIRESGAPVRQVATRLAARYDQNPRQRRTAAWLMEIWAESSTLESPPESSPEPASLESLESLESSPLETVPPERAAPFASAKRVVELSQHAVAPNARRPGYGSGGTRPKFSEREREILALIDAGRTNREIASELFLGVNTIKWYLRKMYKVLGVSDRDECVRLAKQYAIPLERR